MDASLSEPPAAEARLDPGSGIPAVIPVGVQPGFARAPKAGLAPSLEQRRLQVYLSLLLSDIAIVLTSFVVVSYLYLDRLAAPSAMLAAYLLLPIYVTIALYGGTYSIVSLNSWRKASVRAGFSLLVAAALLNFIAFFAKMNAEFSRVVFALGSMTAFGLMVVLRAWLNRWVRASWGPSPINRLVIEAGGPPVQLTDSYRISAAQHGLVPSLDNPETLDRQAHYLRNMDEVIVSCQPDDRARWAMTGSRGSAASSARPASTSCRRSTTC
jgi:hypothetical protein